MNRIKPITLTIILLLAIACAAHAERKHSSPRMSTGTGRAYMSTGTGRSHSSHHYRRCK
jgi:hypothetical protein